jgi:hypothetical protein
MEQQFPLAQLPHIVPPFEEPHVPSVVAFAVAVDPGEAVNETGLTTGSPVVVTGGAASVVKPPFVQPD